MDHHLDLLYQLFVQQMHVSRMVITISNLLITKYKGKYTLKCPFDEDKNDFNRKLNGSYEDIDVYVQCANKCKIFYYGNRGTLQFYCPSLPRGRNIIREIYATYINPDNVSVTQNELDIIRNGKTVHSTRTYYTSIDTKLYQDDLAVDGNIIFDVEETDDEILFKFKYQDMDKLESILKPSTIACNRSPFSTKNLNKSDYKIPDEDLESYIHVVKDIPQNELISLVHISQRFMNKKAKNQKQLTVLNAEKKKLGMKPKEFYHYKGWWDEYVNYVKEEL